MIFEVGKFYKYKICDSLAYHIISEVHTITYGICLVAEEAIENRHEDKLLVIAKNESADNFIEITESEFRKLTRG